MKIGLFSAALLASGALAFGQTQTTATPPSPPATTVQNQRAAQPGVKQGRSAKGDIGSGAGDIGKGTGKGAGEVAKGTGKGAVDLVTLHPVNAAGSIGKGAAVGGKDIGVGAAKGTGKIAKGTGRAIKHIF